MAGEILIFDAAASNADGTDPGSPLNVGPGTLYALREFDAPAPPQTVQYAGTVDTEGSLPASRKHENRLISLKILCSTAAALLALQAKIGKAAREGGTLKWILPNAETVIFDLHATDTFAPKIDKLHYVRAGAYCEVEISLPALPYGRGPEITLSDHVETTLPVLIFTETLIKGDMPGLGRLVIDNDVATAQQMLWWGLRSLTYSSAATAALYYEAESCAMIGAAAAVGSATPSGAGSNVARHSNVGGGAWNGMTYIGTSATAQTHVGSYRVLARFYAPAANTGLIAVRAAWQAYVGAPWIYNDSVDMLRVDGTATEAEWIIADLGMISIPKARVGSQGWLGKIEALSTVTTDDLDMDWIALIPVDDRSGQIQGPSTLDVFSGLRVYSASAVAASGTAVVRSDGVFVSVGGGFWNSATYDEGDYLRVPVTGAEGRTTQFIVAMARGSGTAASTGTVGDPSIDDLSAQLFYTPRYLVVPAA